MSRNPKNTGTDTPQATPAQGTPRATRKPRTTRATTGSENPQTNGNGQVLPGGAGAPQDTLNGSDTIQIGPEAAAARQEAAGTAAEAAQQQFLTALAAGCPKGLHFLVAEKRDWIDRHTGEPGTGFRAEAWREQLLTGSWYFCTGISRKSRSRRGEDIACVRALVLGDIGSKVKATDIKALPSWILETSAGNFQYGFLLDWTEDLAGVAALNSACIRAHIQDPAETGYSRLNRIPGSINDKPGRESFTARMAFLDPQRVYTVDSLAQALGVDLDAEERAAVVSITLEASDEPDDILRWLDAQNMVRARKTEGFLQIVCPFTEEHSDGRDDAAYKPLKNGCAAVGCYHTHGRMGDTSDEGRAVQQAYRERFFDWVLENGGPACTTGRRMPEGFIEMLGALAKAAGRQPDELPPEWRKQKPDEPDVRVIENLDTPAPPPPAPEHTSSSAAAWPKPRPGVMAEAIGWMCDSATSPSPNWHC